MVITHSNFIKTNNDEAKQRLLQNGFILVTESNGVCIFLNNTSFNFSDNEVCDLKLVYTNTLTF